jgi:hypothetical protein
MYMKALRAGVIKFAVDVFDAPGALPPLAGGDQHGDDLVDGFLGLPVSKLHGLSVVRAHNEFRLAASPLSGVFRPASARTCQSILAGVRNLQLGSVLNRPVNKTGGVNGENGEFGRLRVAYEPNQQG